jgi:hypothetical protein
VETELTLPLSDSTKIQLGYSYTDAILTSSFTAGVVPDLVGVSGNRLPGVSRQQATVAVDYGVPFGADREVQRTSMPRIEAISGRVYRVLRRRLTLRVSCC